MFSRGGGMTRAAATTNNAAMRQVSPQSKHPWGTPRRVSPCGTLFHVADFAGQITGVLYGRAGLSYTQLQFPFHPDPEDTSWDAF
jgi:hypothetical protein